VTAAGLVGGTAFSAFATTKHVSGGTWVYDAGSSTNYSNFYHPTKLHRSSVENCYGLVRSADRAGGFWSYAAEPVCLSGNQAYYNVY
jgi:lactococcin 972 family bacteriocin